MGLEKDINQYKFRNMRQKSMINLIYTYNWVEYRMKSLMDKHGLTNQQYNILRILKGSDPKPVSTLQIRERMLDKMSDTSRIVDRLVIKGLVVKKACKTDRRLVDVTISEKGKALLMEMEGYETDMDALLSNLNDADLETLNNLLDKIRE
jgi:MarR family 2-MHQ and catechol resistance regulon transcriptional repressor